MSTHSDDIAGHRGDVVRRTAALAGGVFLAITAAVGLFSYSVRDEGTSVIAAGSGDATTASPGAAPTVADVPTTRSSAATTAAVEATTTPPSTTTTIAAVAVACPPLDGTAEPRRSFGAAPPDCIDPKATYSAIVETTEGTFTIALDAKRAPNTVNNFVFLSRWKFYDGLTFHRVVPGFVIQGGDPLGNGQGGPGYEFADELPDQPGYAIGVVAMANSGPNTNGSQFFIVTGDLGLSVPGRYSRFGKVTKGLDTLQAIDKLGRAPAADNTEFPPTRTITIAAVTIKAVGEKPSRIPGLATTTTTTNA